MIIELYESVPALGLANRDGRHIESQSPTDDSVPSFVISRGEQLVGASHDASALQGIRDGEIWYLRGTLRF